MTHLRWQQIKKSFLSLVALTIITLCFNVAIFHYQLFFSVAQKFQDPFLQSSTAVNSDICIITIDDKSLQSLGIFPWPRSLHAKLISMLDQANPKAIGYDIAFFEKSPNPTEDEALSSALKNAQHPTILPMEIHTIREQQALSRSIPYNTFTGPNIFTGFINVTPDQDLFVRHFPPQLEENDAPLLSFSEAVVKQIKTPTQHLSAAYYPVHTINQYPTFSFVDVLEGRVPMAIFTNKIVLVGSTAATLHDELSIPNQINKISGVFLHALYIDSILQGRSLMMWSDWLTLSLIILLTLVLFISQLLLSTRTSWIVLTSIFISIILLPFFTTTLGYIVPLFYLLITWLSSVLLSSIAKGRLVEKEREQVKSHFERYVNKSVVQELLRNPKMALLGGEKREMTVLFSDIRSFTTISEQMSPTEVVQFLNEYLNLMTEIVLAQGGVLDKYIGDAIMAFWGAPLSQEDHALLGVRTAWLMQKMMQTKGQYLLAKWPQLGTLKIGIGLNSGDMVVGNMGSQLRFDYTVIGDNVNIASRVESLTKYWNANILFTEATQMAVQTEFLCRELDLVKVKGRKEPLKLFDIVAEQKEASPETKAALAEFEQAIVLYRQRDFSNAIAHFSIWQKAMPQDQVVQVFIDRCQDFLDHPVKAKDFHGIIIMDNK